MNLGKSENSQIAPHGGDIYGNDVRLDLSVNINPLGPPECIHAAIEAANKRLSCYPEYDCRGLREAASMCYGVSPDNVLCGSGVSELLSAIGRLYRGRKVLMPVPCFTGYERAFRESEIRYYYLREGDEFDIRRGILDEIMEADALVIGNPNNPTGRLIDRGLLMDMLDAAAARSGGCRVIVDESFIELSDGVIAQFGADEESKRCEGASDNDGCRSLVDVINDYLGLVVLRSVTKAYAVPGVRLGFAISGDSEYLGRLAMEMPEWAVSVYAEEIGKTLLTYGARTAYFEKARKAIREYRMELEGKLGDAGIDFIPSRCNFVLLRTERKLYDEMLGNRVLIRDCCNIRGLGRGWYRMAALEGVGSIVF